MTLPLLLLTVEADGITVKNSELCMYTVVFLADASQHNCDIFLLVDKVCGSQK